MIKLKFLHPSPKDVFMEPPFSYNCFLQECNYSCLNDGLNKVSEILLQPVPHHFYLETEDINAIENVLTHLTLRINLFVLDYLQSDQIESIQINTSYQLISLLDFSIKRILKNLKVRSDLKSVIYGNQTVIDLMSGKTFAITEFSTTLTKNLHFLNSKNKNLKVC